MKWPVCVACGATKKLHHHHLLPRSLGGSNKETNLITLCPKCHAIVHQTKANWQSSSELIRKAAIKNHKMGRRWCPSAYGYDFVEGIAIINKSEMAIIEKIKKLKDEGLSIRKIAKKLNEAGHRKKNGKPWTYSGVWSITKRDRISHR